MPNRNEDLNSVTQGPRLQVNRCKRSLEIVTEAVNDFDANKLFVADGC